MKIELTEREVRLLSSALQNEAVRLAHREGEAGRNKECEKLWNKFVHLEAERKTGSYEKPDSETHQ